MTESKTLPLRSQVPIEETWDLESIFQTPEDWEVAGEELTGYIPQHAISCPTLPAEPMIRILSTIIIGKRVYQRLLITSECKRDLIDRQQMLNTQ